MMFGDAMNSLHEALASAVYRDLPDVEYERRIYEKWDPKKFSQTKQTPSYSIETARRRPFGSEVEVTMFDEYWGSTALGYGGIGGAAMTHAYTVLCSFNNVVCVYFGCGRLAYRIDKSKLTQEQETCLEDVIRQQNMPSCQEAKKKFAGAIELEVDSVV